VKTIKTALSCLLLSAALPALATTVVNFDAEASAHPAEAVDASTLSFVNDLITISPSNSAWLAASGTAFKDGLGNFYGNVGSSTDKTSNKGALAITANSFTVKIEDGFNGLFSVDFAGQGSAHLVALDALGRVLGSFAPATGSNAGCDAGYSCNWNTLSFDLGSAVDVFAVEIFGANGLQWFDNLSFASLNADSPTTPPSGVPEPGGVALSLAALGALGWTRKRIVANKRG